MTFRERVNSHLSRREKLEQLAEEAAELSQAALKCIRAERLSDNPTPVTSEKALDNLFEEFSDVIGCMSLLTDVPISQLCKGIDASPKWKRWWGRLCQDEDTTGDLPNVLKL